MTKRPEVDEIRRIIKRMRYIRDETIELRSTIVNSQNRLEEITNEWTKCNGEINTLLSSIDVASSHNMGHEARRLEFLIELLCS